MNGTLSYKMLIGTFYHNLEEHRRLTLPKQFRAHTDEWVITRGIERALLVLPAANYQHSIQSIADTALTKKANRDTLRLLANEASLMSPDKLGRLQLPEYLVKYAQLQHNVVVVGSWEYVEIWDRDQYHQYCDAIEHEAPQIVESAERSERVS